jgi:putative membrane protein
MLLRLVTRLVVLAVIIDVVAAIVPGIHVHGGFGWYVWLAVIFSVVNLVLGPIFRLLSFPLIILTLGLFLLVVNAALLAITADLSKHLDIDTFGAAVLGGFLIALFSWLAEFLLPARLKKRPADRR